MTASCYFLLLFSATLASASDYGEDLSRIAVAGKVHRRLRREWIWNKMHISEEKNETLPHHVGRTEKEKADFSLGTIPGKYEVYRIISGQRIATPFSCLSVNGTDPERSPLLHHDNLMDPKCCTGDETLQALLSSNVSKPTQMKNNIISSIQNSNAMYVLEGDGANSIFKVDEHTGDVSAYERLDREQKAEYQLTAHILDRTTNKSLEPSSKFRIIVQDVNDNAPIFVKRVFNGSVLEMSPVGTSVTTVTAVDADDPTLLGHADVDYKVINGENYFRVDKSGVIRTAVANLDREQKATYEIVVRAIDGKGLQDTESGTATVRIALIDINDNSPTFNPTTYHFEVLENITLNGVVGRLKVEDIDEPQNRNTKYSFVGGTFQDTFLIIPKPYTNEGIIKPKKPLNFEKTSSYQFRVEATDGDIPYLNSKTKGAKSIATVNIKVLDVDEPPIFEKPSYTFEVLEDNDIKVPIGHVSAIDPDRAKREIRYRALRRTPFIISDTGYIFAETPLDRENSSLHVITVAANEVENGNILTHLETHVPVYIKVLDRNDNAPELTGPYQTRVCENAAPGKVITRISATDKDEPLPGMKFTYSLTSEESNFTLIDNRDNTANITVKYGEFNRELAKIHYLPIVISDNGTPEQSSTNTLTVQVCKCDEDGEFTFCEEATKQVGVSIQALVAIFVCILTIFVIMLLIALRRRHKKDLRVLRKNVAEIHEQLVAYDEEGGGEMDTTSYDVSILNSVRQTGMTSPRMSRDTMPCMYSQVHKPPRYGVSGTGEMAIMIEMKKDEADNDGDLLPYDTLHIFGYEGAESIAESLSSLGSGSSDSDIDYDFLNDWGPRFKMLAELYGLEANEDFAY